MELTVYAELYSNLQEERYATMRPFGRSLTYSLNHARFREDGYAVWEEEDYCSPPLAQKREAALDEDYLVRFFRFAHRSTRSTQH